MADYPDSRLPWRDGAPDQPGPAPLAALALRGVIRLCCSPPPSVSVVTTLAIIFSLLKETISFFGDVPIGDFLFGTKWTPLLGGDPQSFGVIPLVWGTLYLTGIGLLVAVPLGPAARDLSAEFAPRRVRKTIKPMLEMLAGIPTIVLRLLRADVLHARGPARPAGARGRSSTRCRPASSSASW